MTNQDQDLTKLRNKEFSVILEEIEERAKRGSSAAGGHLISLQDVPRLVKALRRAMELVHALAREAGRSVQRSDYDFDITAILNGEEEKKQDLGEPGAVSGPRTQQDR